MMINASAWAKFVIALGKLDAAATKQMEEFINRTGWKWGDGTDVLINLLTEFRQSMEKALLP